MTTTRSIGAERVRLTFNPSADSAVDRIKRATAQLIDTIAGEAGDGRLKSLAMTAAEEAGMWGVKAVTTPIPDRES